MSYLLNDAAARAEQAPRSESMQPATITSMLDTQLSIEEGEIIGAAEAMPEDRYSFAPTNGEFKGVRTFAQEVKHIATVNNRFFGAVIGQPAATPGSKFEAENGPDSIQTKAQIMEYLRDSFALGHKAIAAINGDNAFALMKKPPTTFLTTPAAVRNRTRRLFPWPVDAEGKQLRIVSKIRIRRKDCPLAFHHHGTQKNVHDRNYNPLAEPISSSSPQIAQLFV